jgi:hypothetical protein
MATMKFLPLRFIVLIIVMALNGCSLKLKIAIFNNVGELITVQFDGKDVPVEAGQSAQFDYPGDAQKWMFRLNVAKCAYGYLMPKTLEHYPWRSDSKGTLKVQIESNLDIFLLPPKATEIGSISDFGNLQQDGFPLHPATKSCH